MVVAGKEVIDSGDVIVFDVRHRAVAVGPAATIHQRDLSSRRNKKRGITLLRIDVVDL